MNRQVLKEQYRDAVDLISHLILTKPEVVTQLLKNLGIVFSPPATKEELINEVVDQLAKGNKSFDQDITRLLTVHLERDESKELEAIREAHLAAKDDQFLGGIVGGLAKTAIGGISGLFKKKRRRSRSNGGSNNSAALLAQKRQAAQMKADMQRQMREMREQQRREEERRRRQEEEDRRRRREEEDRQRRLEQEKREAESKKSSGNQNMLIIGGGLLLVTVVLVVSLKPKAAA